MYGLPQDGILAQELLAEWLKMQRYYQSNIVQGLRKHKWRPIHFALVVDDFVMKCIGAEHAKHLINALTEHHMISENWKREEFIGLTINWEYSNKKVHILMPVYVKQALKCFKHN